MKRIVLLIALCFEIWAAPLSQSQEDRLGLRLIAVRTEAEASSLRAQIQAGASFEALAKAHSIDPSSKDGGYLGLFRPCRPELGFPASAGTCNARAGQPGHSERRRVYPAPAAEIRRSKLDRFE